MIKNAFNTFQQYFVAILSPPLRTFHTTQFWNPDSRSCLVCAVVSKLSDLILRSSLCIGNICHRSVVNVVMALYSQDILRILLNQAQVMRCCVVVVTRGGSRGGDWGDRPP